MSDSDHDIATRAVHAGEAIDDQQALSQARALEPPLVLSSAYDLGTAEQAAAAFRGENELYIYGRWRNPSVESLERKLADRSVASCCSAWETLIVRKRLRRPSEIFGRCVSCQSC